MAKVFKHVGLWLAVLFAALCTAGLLVVHAQGENNALYQTVLGKAVNFGITASTFNQDNDLQSNFATKTYTGSSQGVNPNLSGNPGDFLIGNLTTRLQVTKGASKDSTFYVTEEDKSKVDDSQNIGEGNHATINTTYTQDQINTWVDNMITYSMNQGQSLAEANKGKTTENVKIDIDNGNNAIIDTTTLGDNDTAYIYVDSTLFNAIQEAGKLTINKKPNQNVVFNFTQSNGTTLNLLRYSIKINGQQYIDGTSSPNGKESSSDIEKKKN